jgi:hypothetical protein
MALPQPLSIERMGRGKRCQPPNPGKLGRAEKEAGIVTAGIITANKA